METDKQPGNGPAVNGNRWKFSKDIPVSVLGFIILQTVLFTWFLAGQAATLATVVATVSKSEAAAYTKEDARHEREFMEQKFLNAMTRIDDLTRRLAIIEGQTLPKGRQ